MNDPGQSRPPAPAQARSAANVRRALPLRWECRCCNPPILLARYDAAGNVQIKFRDRFYLASGCVHATCPKCGTQHVLDLRAGGDPSTAVPLPDSATGGWS